MILNGKPLLLFGLVATSFAVPILEQDIAKNEQKRTEKLERRKPSLIPSSVTCGPVTFARQDILDALVAAHTEARGSPRFDFPDGKRFPARFWNEATNAKGVVFTDRPVKESVSGSKFCCRSIRTNTD